MKKLPIFICYRQIDGKQAAERVYFVLHNHPVSMSAGPDTPHKDFILDVYYDQATPGVGDWTAIHEPHLKRSHAMVVICTPGAMLVEGESDWVHREIEWWIANRETAPILVDPLNQGDRLVPKSIAEKWPKAQRIKLEDEVSADSNTIKQKQAQDRLRARLLGGIIPASENTYRQELEHQQRTNQRLRKLLMATRALLLVVCVTSVIAALGFWLFSEEKINRANTAAKLAHEQANKDRIGKEAAKQSEEHQKELRKAADDLAREQQERAEDAEEALAVSLLNAIGHNDGAIGDVEFACLWQLAACRNGNTRLKFIEKAVESDRAAQQLRRRLDVCLKAAVGLNESTRREVRKLLTVIMRDTSPSHERLDLILDIGEALSLSDRDYTKAASTATFRATMNCEPKMLRRWATRFQTHAMNVRDAEVSEQALQIANRMIQHSRHLKIVDAFETVAGLLEESAKTQMARVIASELSAAVDGAARPSNQSFGDDLTPLATNFTQIITHLPARDVAERTSAFADRVLTYAAQNQPRYLSTFAITIATVASHLSDDVAFQKASRMATIISTAAVEASQIHEFQSLARGFRALDGFLNIPEERQIATNMCSGISRVIADVGKKSTVIPEAQIQMIAEVFAEIAGSLSAKDASETASLIAEKIIRFIPSTSSKLATRCRFLTTAFGEVAPYLTEQVAAQYADVLASKIEKTIGKEFGFEHFRMDDTWSVLATYLSRDDMARHASTIATTIVERMSNARSTKRFDAFYSVLASGVARRDALGICNRLVNAMTTATDQQQLTIVKLQFLRLADKLSSEGAKQICDQIVESVLARNFASAPHRVVCLAVAFDSLAGKLDNRDASDAASTFVDALTQEIGDYGTRRIVADPKVIADALQYVAGKLDHEKAPVAARTIANLTRRLHGDAVHSLATAFQIVAGKIKQVEAAEGAAAIAEKVVDELESATEPAILESLALAFHCVADTLDEEKADAVAHVVARRLEDMIATSTSPADVESLCRSFALIASELDAILAREIAKLFADAIFAVRALSDNPEIQNLTTAFAVIAEYLSPEQLLAFAKYPICTGSIEQAVLATIYAGAPDRDPLCLWEFVFWLKTKNESLYDASQQPLNRL